MPLPDVACLCFILAISMASSAETREPSDWERLRAEGIALRQSILEAAREGDTALVATFLKGGGDPNLGPLKGDTLLIEAIRSSDPDLVRISVNRIGDFGGKRPVISELSDHAFRFNPSTCSGGDHPSERSDAGHGFMYQLLGFWSSFFVFCAWILL